MAMSIAFKLFQLVSDVFNYLRVLARFHCAKVPWVALTSRIPLCCMSFLEERLFHVFSQLIQITGWHQKSSNRGVALELPQRGKNGHKMQFSYIILLNFLREEPKVSSEGRG